MANVLLEKEVEEDDPVIDSFLSFLSKDMKKHPERIQEFPEALRQQMMELTNGIEVNLDASIEGDVAI